MTASSSGSSISGASGGVYVKYRAAGTVTNAGSITASGTGSAGVDLADGGSVTNNSTGVISGGSFGVFVTGAGGTIANSGSIGSTKYGAIELVKGGSVTNSAGASINGGSVGVYVGTGGTGTITNSGRITAASASGAGVDLAGGGTVTNNSGGSISGAAFGVFTSGVAATLSNSGSISGSHGVGLEAGGSVTNTASASITGQVDGVFAQGGAATLSNAGSIGATAGAGVDFEGGGNVTNLAGGTISGSSFGVFLTGGSGTVTNAGTISGGTYAIDLAAGGSITNSLGGSVAGTAFGVFSSGVAATLNNSGSISGAHGVGLDAGGSVTNAASGSITGQLAGVFAQVSAATLSNAGIINATAGAGADFESGGSVTNLAGGTISGSSFGVFLTGGSGTVTNAGTISGGTYAIDFAGSATNRLVVDPGAVFVGRVIGGSGANTLELAAGTGSIGGVGTGSFNNFQVVAVDAGANWTLTGANIAPTILDNGTVSITGSLDVSTAIDASSTGLFQLGSAATFEVAAATGATTKINFQGSSSELVIDNAASFGTHVGTASYAGPQLQHFAAGDKIDLKNFSSAGVRLIYNASTGVLQVSNSANQVASFDFQTSSLAGNVAFAAAGDGATGVFITDVDPPTTVIEAVGSTSLVQAGSNYFLNPVAGGTGPELKYNGAPVTVGEFGPWTPIGTELTATGYELAWKVTGADQYLVWNVDSNGNYISNMTGVVSGTSSTLEALETSFHQDLNGDGVIRPITAVVESFGSTSLVQVGNNYILDRISTGTGPVLSFGGTPVAVGQFGGWMPIGAELTATGYEVAWKVTGADQYLVWNVDSSGNYISNMTGVVSGTSSTLESLEASFHQDLNGDGVVFTSGSGSVVGAGSLLVGAGAGVELTGAYSGTISFAGASGTLTIDHSANFSGHIAGQLATGDVIDLADVTSGAGATITYSGNNSPGTLTVSDGTHTASIALLGNYSLANFTASSDGHGGTSVIDPPLLQAGSDCSNPANGSAVHPITISDFGWHDHASPGDPAPSSYVKLAGLLDQYMAAGPAQDAAGLCKTSWTAPQQTSLGDKEFLTKPHG